MSELGALQHGLLDTAERLMRWEQALLTITQLPHDAKSIAEHALAEVDCDHKWAPLPHWDNDEDHPWEQCQVCEANRPNRDANPLR